ncbi:MAG: Fe-S-containing hydro-lyase [Acholeplasmataceae bacterium]|jgi:fumarate hydratase subunit beta|nr:Fe-S-containing hydro-lyase [Acholeplasmataceae bacterium]
MKLKTPITQQDIKNMKAGEIVYISGTIYTGRDAAHKRMVEALNEGKPLPFDVHGQVIYYVGPTPAKPGRPIGSCGPTSSYRMDKYSPFLMKEGLKVMIGKGDRSDEFIQTMIKEKAVYLQAVGGAGALLSRKVKTSEVIGYHDLGAEAIYRLEVEDFPAIVTYDIYGGNLIVDEVKKYQTKSFDL